MMPLLDQDRIKSAQFICDWFHDGAVMRLSYLEPGQYMLSRGLDKRARYLLLDSHEAANELKSWAYSISGICQVYKRVEMKKWSLFPDELIAELIAQELER
jgi:hypothetical protein